MSTLSELSAKEREAEAQMAAYYGRDKDGNVLEAMPFGKDIDAAKLELAEARLAVASEESRLAREGLERIVEMKRVNCEDAGLCNMELTELIAQVWGEESEAGK